MHSYAETAKNILYTVEPLVRETFATWTHFYHKEFH